MIEENNYALLKDNIAKKIFMFEGCGIKYATLIIAEVLKLDYQDVYDNLEYVFPETGVNINLVNSEADLVFKNDKMYINIEINKQKDNLRQINKNESYIFELSIRQLINSKYYEKLIPVVQINIDGFDKFGKNEFIYHSRLLEEKYHLLESKNIEIYHINLSYLRKKCYTEIEEEKLKELLYLFVCNDLDFLLNYYKGDAIMTEVVNNCKDLVKKLDELLYYNKEELERLDEEDKIIQGEKNKQIEIAKNMLKDEMSLDIISKYTGLTAEEIEKLK